MPISLNRKKGNFRSGIQVTTSLSPEGPLSFKLMKIIARYRNDFKEASESFPRIIFDSRWTGAVEMTPETGILSPLQTTD